MSKWCCKHVQIRKSINCLEMKKVTELKYIRKNRYIIREQITINLSWNGKNLEFLHIELLGFYDIFSKSISASLNNLSYLDVKDMKRIMTFHVAKSCLLLISLSVLLEELSSNNDTFYVVSELDGFRWSVRNHRQL